MKTKRSYGSGKRNRKNFRFTEQIKDLIEKAASQMGRSENDIVADAVFDYLGNRDRFVNCPGCGAYMTF